jgi:hypothetical protein
MSGLGVKIPAQDERLATIDEMVQHGTKLFVASVRLGNMAIKGRHDNVPKVAKGHHNTKMTVRHNAGQKPRRQSM